MASIIQVRHITVGCEITVRIVGQTLVGRCIRRGIGTRVIRWQDGSEGRITDSFLAECQSVSLIFDDSLMTV